MQLRRYCWVHSEENKMLIIITSRKKKRLLPFQYLFSTCLLSLILVTIFLHYCLIYVKSPGPLWWTCRVSVVLYFYTDAAVNSLDCVSFYTSVSPSVDKFLHGNSAAAGMMLTEIGKQARSPLFLPHLSLSL